MFGGGGGNLGSIYATIGADYSQLDMAERRVRSFTTNVTRSFGSAVRAATGLQGAIIGFAASMSFRQIINYAKNYESAIVDMGKVTEQTTKTIRKQVESIGPSLGDVTELTKGYYQVISAGVTKPKKALDLLVVASKAARAAHVQQSDTVRALTKLMAGYAGEVKNATEAADLLFRIERIGQTTFQELVPIIGSLANLSRAAGLNTREMGGALALLTQTAGSTAEATTQLEALITSLIKPTDKMVALMKDYGGVQQAIQKIGFVETLRKIDEATQGSTEALAELLGGRKEALIAFSGLMVEHFGRVIGLIEEMGGAAGGLEKAWQRYLKSFEGISEKFWNAVKNTFMKAGLEVLPVLGRILEDITTSLVAKEDKVVGFFRGLASTIEKAYKVAKFLSDNLWLITEPLKTILAYKAAALFATMATALTQASVGANVLAAAIARIDVAIAGLMASPIAKAGIVGVLMYGVGRTFEYYFETFDEVKKYVLSIVATYEKAWLTIKYHALAIWPAIKLAFYEGMEALSKQVEKWINGIANVMRKVPFIKRLVPEGEIKIEGPSARGAMAARTELARIMVEYADALGNVDEEVMRLWAQIDKAPERRAAAQDALLRRLSERNKEAIEELAAAQSSEAQEGIEKTAKKQEGLLDIISKQYNLTEKEKEARKEILKVLFGQHDAALAMGKKSEEYYENLIDALEEQEKYAKKGAWAEFWRQMDKAVGVGKQEAAAKRVQKALDAVLKSGKYTTKELNTAWDTLKSKNIEATDAMKVHYVKANLDIIKNVNSTADEIAEALRRLEKVELDVANSFMLGWERAFLSFRRRTQLIADFGEKTAKDLRRAFSDTFFLAMKGQISDLGELWESFAINLRDSFMRLVADIAAEKIIMYFRSAWAGAPGGQGTIEKLLGIDVPFLTFARGGEVPGLWNGRSGFAGDTVMAMLTPGEWVVPREVAQLPEMRGFLEAVTGPAGQVAVGKNIPAQTGQRGLAYGGLVEPGLPHYGFFSFIGNIIKSIISIPVKIVKGVAGVVGKVLSKFSSWVADTTIGKVLTGAGLAAAAVLSGGTLVPAILTGAATGAATSVMRGGDLGDILTGALTGGAIGGATAGLGRMLGGAEKAVVKIGGKYTIVDKAALTALEGTKTAILSGPVGDVIAQLPSSSLEAAFGLAKQLGQDAFSKLVSLPAATIDKIKELATHSWNEVKELNLPGMTQSLWAGVTKLPKGVWDAVKKLGASGMGFLREFTLFDYVSENISTILRNFKLLLAGMSGGRALGQIGSRLGIPQAHAGGLAADLLMRVRPYEYVIREDAARRIGYDALEEMNATGALPNRVGGGEGASVLQPIYLTVDGHTMSKVLVDLAKTNPQYVRSIQKIAGL